MKFTGITTACILSVVTLYAQSVPDVYVELENHYHTNSFEACVRMEKRISSFASQRRDTLAANALFYLGDAYNQIGQPDKAVTLFEKEKDLLLALGMAQTTELSNSLNNLAFLYLRQGSYQKAAATADELLAHDRKLFSPTDPAFIESAVYIADIYIQLDRLADAESLLSNTIKRQSGKSTSRGILLNKLGDLYTYAGRYSRASAALLEALDIHAELTGDQSPEYISAAINLGVLYMNQGKYAEAEEIFEIALSQLDPADQAYAPVLNNQALVLQSLGQLDRAERAFSDIKTMDSLQVGTQHPDYAITLSNMGLVYADRGKYQEAESALTRALTIQKEAGDANTLSYARKLNNLAKVYQMADQSLRALPLLQEALSIFRKNMGKESPEYATAAYNLGVALWRCGKGEPGLKYLKSSAAIRAKVLGKRHPQYTESILKIAEYQWSQKSIPDARVSFREVFNNYYSQIDETFPVLTEEEKSKFYYTKVRGDFDKFNSLAIDHHIVEPGLLTDMYDYLVNTKGAIMLATGKVKSSIRASGDSSLIQQFEQWQASKEQIAKLYSVNQDHEDLDSLLRASNQLEKELARRSSVFEGHFLRRKYDFKEIQRTLKPGDAAVEVIRCKKFDPANGGEFKQEIVYAFLIITPDTKEHPTLVLIPNGKDLETKFLRYYRNNIKYNLQDLASYKNYFGPLAAVLRQQKIDRLYFSPDGVYNQINLNTFENPDSKKFLIDEFDVRLVTNSRELVEDNTTNGEQQAAVLIGYPKFNLSDSELVHKPGKRLNRGGASRTWRGGLLRYMHGEEGISLLPGTEIEIEKIAALFGADVSVFKEQSASEHAAKTVKNPQVLHIATHGYFLEDEVTGAKSTKNYFSNPLLNAGLILAGAENFLKSGEPVNEEGDDGVLTAFEAMNLALDNTQLVVLSACETALGDVQNGEGVYGLQRAFQLAGSQSIVMSLWSVDDEATQRLMTTFYEEMLRSGDQHASFRTAQRKVKELYPSPFYWGAFIMVGI